MLQKLSNFFWISRKNSLNSPDLHYQFPLLFACNFFFRRRNFDKKLLHVFRDWLWGLFFFEPVKLTIRRLKKVDLSPSSVKPSAESNIFAGEVMGPKNFGFL
jgi:hypothetical protein